MRRGGEGPAIVIEIGHHRNLVTKSFIRKERSGDEGPRVKLIWDWKPRPVRLHAAQVQLNWTQGTGPLGGRKGSRAGRKGWPGMRLSRRKKRILIGGNLSSLEGGIPRG